MQEVKRPNLGISFDDLDDEPVETSPTAASEREERKAVAQTLNAASNAPKEHKRAARSRAKSQEKAKATRTKSSDFRRRQGRPSGERHESFSVRTTEAHLRFLYSLTEIGPGGVVDGFEHAILTLAQQVIDDPQYNGWPVPEPTLELARTLIEKYPDKR